MTMKSQARLDNVRLARKLWGPLGRTACCQLKQLVESHSLSIAHGDLLRLDNRWYVTHTGLLRIANRNRCTGIQVEPLRNFCDAAGARWIFKATVYKAPRCKGFVGFGDADPSNVSDLVRGAEMRVAETRAVNRALRKAYGVGICSVEEIGSLPQFARVNRHERKIPPPSTNGSGRLQPRLRDLLCQLIRRHQLDPVLVKSYALDYCKTKTLKEASREQVDNFITHLSDWADKDKNALLYQLNSYSGVREGAA